MIPTKEEYIKIIMQNDDFLAEVKPWVDAHAGQELIYREEISLLENIKKIMKYQIIFKRALLRDYGITVMTKVSP